MYKKNKYTDPARIEKMARDRQVQDLKDIIKLVLSAPVKEGEEIVEADGIISLEKLSKANTDVQTRMVMQITKGALTGDIKSARFLTEYAGLEPPKQQRLSVELPTIIDDLTCRDASASESPVIRNVKEKEEGDE
jgi:hypothetical protein